MNIAYSSSQLYFNPTYVSIYSLLSNTSSKHNIILLSDRVHQECLSLLRKMIEGFGSTFECVDVSTVLDEKAKIFKFPLMRGGYSTYARVFLSDILPHLDDVLLIDSDTLVLGDIASIQKCATSSVMSACRDYVVSNRYSFHEEKELSASDYYNMGVLNVNLKMWREKNVSSYLAKNYDPNVKLKIADQSIINIYLRRFVDELDMRFNFYTYFHYGFDYLKYQSLNNSTNFLSESDFEVMRSSPIIVHFVGTWYERPWYKKNICPHSAKYLEYWDKCFSRADLFSVPPRSLPKRIYDAMSLFVFNFFGVNSYFYFRYKFIQSLKVFI